MIEIDYQLLSKDAVDNLIIEYITRAATDYGEYEVDVAKKKSQILAKLEEGEAVIVYSSEEGVCTIVSLKEKQAWLSKCSNT
jgi:uncharacterized protein YheU (UPF0270 family)